MKHLLGFWHLEFIKRGHITKHCFQARLNPQYLMRQCRIIVTELATVSIKIYGSVICIKGKLNLKMVVQKEFCTSPEPLQMLLFSFVNVPDLMNISGHKTSAFNKSAARDQFQRKTLPKQNRTISRNLSSFFEGLMVYLENIQHLKSRFCISCLT